MGKDTKIQWTDHTFNPWHGCVKVSQGCKNCYADVQDRRFGESHWGPVAPRKMLSDANWQHPIVWNRDAEKEGIRRKVFCASMADVFEKLPDGHPSALAVACARLRLWFLIEETPWLDWQLLTKRPENIHAMVRGCWHTDWPRNVWIGTSVEDQENADTRISHLRDIPAQIRFLSVEPLLGPVDNLDLTGIHWVIVGGESGPGARPFHTSWAQGIVEQCRKAGVACFVKQLGSNPKYANSLDLPLKDKKGGDWLEWPEDLRVREFPNLVAVSGAEVVNGL